MDPLSLAFLGLKGAGAIMSIFGAQGAFGGAKRITRQKQAILRGNADLATQRATFEQNRIDDQVDAVQGAQVNYYSGGNLDPTMGSPAVVQAMTAAQGQTDMMLAAARGVQERADAYQQIADLESGLSAQRQSMSWGIGTTLLNTASDLAAQFGPKGAFSGAFGKSTNSTTGSFIDNSFERARRIGGFTGGYGV